MARRPRRTHSTAFKAKVAVAAIKSEKTLIALVQDFDDHPNQIKQSRAQLLEGAPCQQQTQGQIRRWHQTGVVAKV